jgi:shikimate dehydrogenase
MSAVMHNAAFRMLNLDFKYELLEVKPGALRRTALNTLVDAQVRGANVTIPYKVAIMEYLNVIDQEASKIGAVNTIVNNGGMLKGYNTDGVGALRALNEAYGSLKDAKVVVLGSGGAARAICYKLSESASEITILNRTVKHAVALSDYLSSLSECKAYVSADSFQEESLRKALTDADIIINTTPVGMYPEIDSSPIESKFLRSDFLVFDSVYNPLMTKLLLDAKAAGAKILTGVHMLLYQGVATFELWVGKKAPETIMMGAVMRALEENKV